MAKEKGALAARMKELEAYQAQVLTPETPAIIRIDGRAFHTFTRPFEKPWDRGLHSALIDGANELLMQIAGAVFAYVQSDEVSILVGSRPVAHTWFGGTHAKITSVSASVMTAAFNRYLLLEGPPTRFVLSKCGGSRWATFDSRVFSISAGEVEDYFVWRQRDAIRNSVLTMAQIYLGHREVSGMKREALIARLADEGVDWHGCEPWQRFGSCVRRAKVTRPVAGWPAAWSDDLPPTEQLTRTETLVETPVFTEDRAWLADRMVW